MKTWSYKGTEPRLVSEGMQIYRTMKVQAEKHDEIQKIGRDEIKLEE